MAQYFRSVTFSNYKSFKSYRLWLRDFNALVGPNNVGKSTILSAFRILSEGLRRANARSPTRIHIADGDFLGWRINTENIPIATENIFTDYDDSEPASIKFALSDGSSLSLVFPESDLCYLTCDSPHGRVTRPRDFRAYFDIHLGFSPILGPVEHEEPLYNRKAALHALTTAQQARNFRNIWYHFPDRFDRFREFVQLSWPGMDILPPEIQTIDTKPFLRMFCTEHRVAREIHWAGFGFQVWCEMLTYVVHAENDTFFVIDEPDIYLHADLQRQLVSLLHRIPAAVLIATHSTEILTECDPSDIVLVDKAYKQARRIRQPQQLGAIFGSLGSTLNPVLTQLAKTRRALFVEGKDFTLLSRFARSLRLTDLAIAADFAVVPTGGFNVTKLRDFAQGVETTLGQHLRTAVILDRDYRHPNDTNSIQAKLADYVDYVSIHDRKEIENYLLIPSALDRAISRQLDARARRQGIDRASTPNCEQLLWSITDSMKLAVQSRIHASYCEYYRRSEPHVDNNTINERVFSEFEDLWSSLDGRLRLAPGKEVLSELNRYLQDSVGISLTPRRIIDSMYSSDIPDDLSSLLGRLDDFRQLPVL